VDAGLFAVGSGGGGGRGSGVLRGCGSSMLLYRCVSFPFFLFFTFKSFQCFDMVGEVGEPMRAGGA